MTGPYAFLRYLRLKILVSFFRVLAKFLEPPLTPKPDAVLRIPSRDNRRAIKAHLYKPFTGEAGNGGPHPVLINFYGSAFVLPLHGADDNFCRLIATKTDYVVLDVDYRIGPEDPFPAAIHDVEDAITYVLNRPEKYKTSQVSVSGFSSGGTLALIAPTLFASGTFQWLLLSIQRRTWRET